MTSRYGGDDTLEEGYEMMTGCHDRQKEAAEEGLAPPTGRKVILLGYGPVFRKTEKVLSWSRQGVLYRKATGELVECRYHIASADLEDGTHLVGNKIEPVFEYVSVIARMAWIGYETGVADISCSYEFPVQDEDDPYNCYHDIENAWDDLRTQAADACDDEDSCVKEALASVQDQWMRGHCLCTLAMEAIYDYAECHFECQDDLDDCMEWDMYEAAGQRQWDTQYHEDEELTQQLMHLGMGGDLHTGNVGMWNGSWVCIDFSPHCIR